MITAPRADRLEQPLKFNIAILIGEEELDKKKLADMSKIDKLSSNLNSFDAKAKIFIKTQKMQREKETNLFEVQNNFLI